LQTFSDAVVQLYLVTYGVQLTPGRTVVIQSTGQLCYARRRLPRMPQAAIGLLKSMTRLL